MKSRPGRKTFDKRIAFIAAALSQKLTSNADLANFWYVENGGSKLGNDEALRRFKEWIEGDAK